MASRDLSRLVGRAVVGLLVVGLRAWRLLASPLLGPACRFEPSCSRYAEDALRLHGPLRGGALAVGRLLRCHPGCEGGYDPVRASLSPAGPPSLDRDLRSLRTEPNG